MAYIRTNKSDFDPRLAAILPDYSHAPPDTRIIELLRTNAPPTIFERKNLENILSELPDRIAELDSCIHATTSLLAHLTKDRDQALVNHANAKNILSPSRRIPPEVLTEIFIWCWASYGRRDPPLEPCGVAWTLTHVSRKWREVAIATPSIWSTIRLDFLHDDHLAGSHVHEAAFMLGRRLDRARPHDLDVTIRLDDDISTHPACVVLLPSVRYWKSLDVWGMPSDLRFLSPCRGFFDRLETAQMLQWHDEVSESMDIFALAPRLRSFTKSTASPMLLPANLIELCDFSLFNADTYATLRKLVNIEILSLLCSSYSSALPRIQLPRLSRLELTINLRSIGAAFLTYNHFDVPSLTHLQITLSGLSRWHPTIPPHVFQPISSSTVTSLILIFPPSGSLRKNSAYDIEQDLLSYCRLPNLRCLTVEECPNINLLLGALSICPGKNVIFPKMSELDIDGNSSMDGGLDMHILVELVQSRRDKGALREMKFVWQGGLVNDDAGICTRWKQLCAPGAGIQISASIEGL
ncbi:hypothetical protein ARMSODRAFT_963565 [Armillaria solidipes]|uniref:Uncharacterized protein n=1 Tax=Armillaria solidipes TaxID=1076256 RepID=A0A2H3BAE1_9AGAR|nr:hypothetical protein ARMSODRAFT_963565 [Armillaria solidipes]